MQELKRGPYYPTVELYSMVGIAVMLQDALDFIRSNTGVISAISGSISAVTAAMLVWFYYQQRNIAEAQQELAERQTALMELNHQPEIVTTGWSAEGKNLTFTINNVGNGPATNLRVITEPRFENPEYEPHVEICNLHRVGQEEESRNLEGGHIEAGEKAEFTTHLGTNIIPATERETPVLDDNMVEGFDNVVAELYDTGTERMDLHFRFEYFYPEAGSGPDKPNTFYEGEIPLILEQVADAEDGFPVAESILQAMGET